MFVITLGDMLALGIFVFCVLVVILVTVAKAIRQGRCPHDGGVHETQACDAICRQCGKNLGFIGSPLNRQRRQQHLNRPQGRKQP